MRHKKIVATLAGLCLVTSLVIGYAVAQDRGAPGRPGPAVGGPGAYGQPGGPSPRSPAMPGGRGAPGMYPGGPGMPGMQRGVPQVVQQMSAVLHLIERMRDASFDPEVAGIMAVSGLKDDVRRNPKHVTADLEKQLAKTKTLGLRNAIRMTLKDIYKRIGEDEKVLDHLRAMLAENDKALQEEDREDDEDND